MVFTLQIGAATPFIFDVCVYTFLPGWLNKSQQIVSKSPQSLSLALFNNMAAPFGNTIKLIIKSSPCLSHSREHNLQWDLLLFFSAGMFFFFAEHCMFNSAALK